MLLSLGSIGGCFDRDIAAGFCGRDCAELWTAACEEQCGLERPVSCPDSALSCPVTADPTDGAISDTGEATGSVSSAGISAEDDESPMMSGESAGQSGDDSSGGDSRPLTDDDGDDEPVQLGPCGELCPEGRPICDEERRTCVECGDDLHCRRSQLGLYCVDQHCVGCSTDADCGSPQAPHCDETAGACVGCRSSADCADVVEDATPLPFCDVATRTCVQCTGTDFATCGTDRVTDKALVCDTASSSCTNRQAGSARLCDTCLSDAHCGAGMRCAQEVFGDETLGYVCLWELDSAGGPSSCSDDSAKPFVMVRRQSESIDGAEVDVCALRATTCEAFSEAGVQPCSGAEGDDDCGVDGLADGLCRKAAVSADRYVCTTACQNDSDCAEAWACLDGGFCEADGP